MEYLSTVEQRQIHEILGDFFRYRLGLRGTEWVSPVEPEVSPDNAEICATLRNLSDHFHAGCHEALEELAERCLLTENLTLRTLENGFHTSMNELMSERGVSWERIVVAFSYAVETAARLPAQDPINTVYNWTTAFTARTLMPWIRENNGWVSWDFDFRLGTFRDCCASFINAFL